MLSAFDLIAILLVLTATFGWVNHHFIQLPHTIGLLVMGLGASLLLVGVELAFPGVLAYEDLAGVIRQIDFQATVLNGMLAFLLFAGALHVNLSVLRDRALAVGSMATVGIVISTAIVGTGFWLAAGTLGVAMPFEWPGSASKASTFPTGMLFANHPGESAMRRVGCNADGT